MPLPYVEEVYKRSGLPTYTFVEPVEYKKLLVALRTPGRGLVLEGPSGIGKTTSVAKALEDLGLGREVLNLTARSKDDRDLISELPDMGDIGIVIIDDFHRLDEDTKQRIADYMKILADEGDSASKLVVVGINKAGDSLVKFARDLRNRLDTIHFEANPLERVLGLIEKGEKALNLHISFKGDIARDTQGSFHLTQMLCHEACLLAGVTERQEPRQSLSVSFEVVKQRVIDELASTFSDIARSFAKGPKLRREGRAPYLHMLYWLAEGNEWSLSLDQARAQHPNQKGSVGQVVDKGYLEKFLDQSSDFSECLHYDPTTRVLSVEDPKFVYYLRNLLWSKFTRQVGFLNIDFRSRYDFALSFAGSDRAIAKAITDKLMSAEIEVFYDKDEQHRILAENVEDYLGPIYRTEAQFVIALLGPDYPKKIWTKFESEQFKSRFGEGSVIPIWFSDAPPGLFDKSTTVGGLTYNRDEDMEPQIDRIVDTLLKKLSEVHTEQQLRSSHEATIPGI